MLAPPGFQVGQVALENFLCAFQHRKEVLCGLRVATISTVSLNHFFLSSDGDAAQLDMSSCVFNPVGD